MVGIRIPQNKIIQDIIVELDAPITSTSANISGTVAPATKEEVNVPYDLFIEGGSLSGTPSVVVDIGARKILRPGDNMEAIAAFLKTLG